MSHELENKFFIEFQYQGAALLVLKMMNFIHCGGGSEVPARKDYPDGVIAEIKERTENCDVWPWSGVDNICPLFDEIELNLGTQTSAEDKMRYAERILQKFQLWTCLHALNPDILDGIRVYSGESPEYYFTKWRDAFNSFAQKFAVSLAKNGIDILKVQKRCGINIIKALDIDELWVYFGTRESADYYLTRLNVSCKGNKKHNVLDKLFSTNKARVLIEEMVKAGFLKPCDNLYQWEGTAALLGYFIDKSSDFLNLRPSNNRIPWKKYEGLIANLSLMKATAQQAVNDYQNKCFNKPEGYEVIEQIIASIPD